MSHEPSRTLEYGPSAAPPAPRGDFRRFLRVTLAVPEVGALIPLIAFTALFALLAPRLLSAASIGNVLRTVSFVGIIAVGQAVLMIAGELDLSVGAVAGLCAVVAAWLMKEMGCPYPIALAAGLLAGALAGLANGVIAVLVGVPAFIATLGMLYVVRGATFLIADGRRFSGLPDPLAAFGRAEPLGVSWSFFVLLLVAIACDLALRFTTFGRMVYATGGNREVARVAGINTAAVKIGCFVLTGALSALAGLMTMARFNVGQPEIGNGWELSVIAGVVIGGTSLFGGVGSVAGACLGLLIMQIVSNGLVMTGANPHWQTVAVGAIMIAAVTFDLLRRRTRVA